MKRKLEVSELIFKIISYVLLTVFSLCCLYPFLYAVSASISRLEYVENGVIQRYEKVTEFDDQGNPLLPEDTDRKLVYPLVDAEGKLLTDEVGRALLVYTDPESVKTAPFFSYTASNGKGVSLTKYEMATELDDQGNPLPPEDPEKKLVYLLVNADGKMIENKAAVGQPLVVFEKAEDAVTAPYLNYSERAQLELLPKEVQFRAFSWMFGQNVFWNAYSNTLFLTVYGTAWSLLVAILGAYALSKKRLLFRKFFNFFLVFTMWFSAGIVPQYLNYIATKGVFNSMGITDDKWLVVIAMGMAAMNIILLRNTFENVPGEIEEAAIVDGASEFQVLRQVFIPMSKSTIATVALFFAVSRWNGYFWARQMISNPNEQPLQVYIRDRLEYLTLSETLQGWKESYAADSLIFALIVCSIIPILVIYPFIQKYFAKGTNAGGVKE